jgi:DNA topoisomerase-2
MKRKAQDKIVKLSDIDHALQSGDFYIGQSVHTESPPMERFVFNNITKKMEFQQTKCPKGPVKLFDEAIVNASDNITRGAGTNHIKVTINRTKGEVTVWNNGQMFKVEKTVYDSRVKESTEKAYQPEVGFFHCKTSTAYNKKQKTTGGKFGLGAKLISIFSLTSTLEMSDGETFYRQTSTDHMRNVCPPVVKVANKKQKTEPYISITFQPDMTLFYPEETGGEKPSRKGFENDVFSMFLTRVYDIAGTTSAKVTLQIDDEKPFKVPVKNFKDYVKLFLPTDLSQDLEKKEDKSNTVKIGYHKQDRWEICLIANPYPLSTTSSVSFVNNVNTFRGGEHVKHIYSQVSNFLQKKLPKLDVRRISNAVFIFVNAVIEDPSFDSQSKEVLFTRPNKFGSTCDIPVKCLNVLNRNGVLADLVESMKEKEMVSIRREIGAGRKKSVGDIPNLQDARYAGKRESSKCTLYVVEGVSAMELAEVGLSTLGGDYNGAFAVKGKVINAMQPLKKLGANAEFQHICRILGLQLGKPCKRSELRYGRVCIMTDTDLDGDHIKMLFTYLFRVHWPELLREPGFLCFMITPLVVAVKGKQRCEFFTMQSFDAWKDAKTELELKKWDTLYYKGLGTSTSKDGRRYFKNLANLNKTFCAATDTDFEALDLAMKMGGKAVSDKRKLWMADYDVTKYIDYPNVSSVSYADFVHLALKHYCMMAMVRSIPKVEDGQTPAQRKTLYTFLHHEYTKDIKLAEVIGIISNFTDYHHGQDSLGGTTVGLAQSFVGKQNINVLVPSGQFGTGKDGGKVHASVRYIFSRLQKITRLIFRKEDDPVLVYQTSEKKQIEPVVFAPIIPMILVNGVDSVSFAFSTGMTCHKPEELIDCIRTKLQKGNTGTFPKPWYHKFQGDIVSSEENGSLVSQGKVKQAGPFEWHITELPLKTWRIKFKERLEGMVQKGSVVEFHEQHRLENVFFQVHVRETEEVEKDPIKFFKLESSLSTNLNFFSYDKNSQMHKIKQFTTTSQVFDDFFEARKLVYKQRIIYSLNNLQEQIPFLNSKKIFIEAAVDHRIPFGSKKIVLSESMEKINIPLEYHDKLLKMNIMSLTAERVKEIQKEADTCLEKIKFFETATVSQLWNSDLDELEKALPEFWESRLLKLEDDEY